MTITELSEHYNAPIVQSLVDARLVVRIGNKYDIYWDIFRDFLNYGRVPAQDNYLLRMQLGPVLKAMRVLNEMGGTSDFTGFRQCIKLSEHSAMNVVRDLRLMGLVTVDAGHVQINVEIGDDPGDKELTHRIRTHIKDRLVQNRLVSRILTDLKSERTMGLSDVGTRLSSWCPYVLATPKTWRMYARVLAAWLDLADLATYSSRSGTLSYYESSIQFRERDLAYSVNSPGGPAYLRNSVQPGRTCSADDCCISRRATR